LKEVKKNWSHKLKCASSHYYENAKLRGDPSTIGTADLKPIHYATRLTPLEWQTDCFIRTGSCEAVWSNNFWNKKMYGWFCSHFLKNTEVC